MSPWWLLALNMSAVPWHMFMDYVPDIAAFKELDFKGADSYICVVCVHLISVRHTCAQMRRSCASEQTQAHEAILRAAIRSSQGAHGPRGTSALFLSQTSNLMASVTGAQKSESHSCGPRMVPS